ncbi:hypothetical protein [Deinococcus soli (ex Cha et al. 2016)]|uniref:Uncharacterized protein n=2 Tax=Deinococcus soli (ex Cha et al. 2016) TaxID=1309411 RepID=A0AAE4BM01_9DEIO|nr:hypothetical protein [Deinococcus soli (ex Cha et al. 2016)]MDR6218555.1 hypothetical protein [Deinococcus soli (ex Cha et al. 2016)]MDR6329295.1 hypothetical protein [Deinococcus soli (ex Cha et al. 2016)]MDR6751568.1 hypothetical protein [Deinococcus soli (ex Cha et al. 2016)]
MASIPRGERAPSGTWRLARDAARLHRSGLTPTGALHTFGGGYLTVGGAPIRVRGADVDILTRAGDPDVHVLAWAPLSAETLRAAHVRGDVVAVPFGPSPVVNAWRLLHSRHEWLAEFTEFAFIAAFAAASALLVPPMSEWNGAVRSWVPLLFALLITWGVVRSVQGPRPAGADVSAPDTSTPEVMDAAAYETRQLSTWAAELARDAQALRDAGDPQGADELERRGQAALARLEARATTAQAQASRAALAGTVAVLEGRAGL